MSLTPPASLVNKLTEGEYIVDLETSFKPGEMIIADCHIQGQTNNTIILQSHTCHPHMANDGFAGTALMIRLMQLLMKRKNFFSYRLILCPEHLGTIFYLNKITPNELNSFVGGVFSEMLGTRAPLTMGSTFWGNHYLDSVMYHVGRFYLENFYKLVNDGTPFKLGSNQGKYYYKKESNLDLGVTDEANASLFILERPIDIFEDSSSALTYAIKLYGTNNNDLYLRHSIEKLQLNGFQINNYDFAWSFGLTRYENNSYSDVCGNYTIIRNYTIICCFHNIIYI